MRTTLNINDELYRAIKIKAVNEHRTVTELVDAALRRLLDPNSPMNSHAPRPDSPPFPTIITQRLTPAPSHHPGIAELNELIKDTEIEADSERHDASTGH